jgi:hypothetical protein
VTIAHRSRVVAGSNVGATSRAAGLGVASG